MPSKASSKTCTGSTLRTGPKRSRVCARIQRSSVADLGVGEPGVGLGHRHQLVAIPHREGVVGVEVRAPAVPGRRVDHHAIEGERVDLPFPPRAALAAGAVRCVPVLQHHAFDTEPACVAAQRCEGFPVGRGQRLRDAELGRRILQHARPAPRVVRATCRRAGPRHRVPAGRRRETAPGLHRARPGSHSCGRCASAAWQTAAALRRARPAPRHRARCRKAASARRR